LNILKSSGLLILIICCVCFSESEAQQVESFIIKSDSLQVGDTLKYNITLNTEQEYDKIIFPDTSDFGEYIEIKNRKRYKLSPYKDSVSYTLQFFGTEDTILPSQNVLLVNGQDTTTVTTAQELVSFASALDGEEFKPLKPIFDFALAYWPYLVGLLLLLLLGYLLYRYLNKKDREPDPKPVAPEPTFVNPIYQLEQTIQTLRNDRGITERRDFKTFYSTLGDALRLYIERLHKLPALESTTRELMADLDDNTSIDGQQYHLLKEILNEADMVKFAKYTPPVDQAFYMLDEAVKFTEIARKNDAQKITALKEEFKRDKQKPSVDEGPKRTDSESDLNRQPALRPNPNDMSQPEPEPVVAEKGENKPSSDNSDSTIKNEGV